VENKTDTLETSNTPLKQGVVHQKYSYKDTN